MLPQERTNNIWYSGYCDETTSYCANTNLDGAGTVARMRWMQKHVPECDDCTFANHLKELEANVAKALGPEGLELFRSGGDVLSMDGAIEIKDLIIDQEIKQGTLTSAFLPWMKEVKERHGKDFPVRRHK